MDQIWNQTSRVAHHWQSLDKGKVKCELCPRHCKTNLGQMGFCGVRGNVDGQFHTFNYGKSVAAAQEVIETEAVNHFMPGARILSLGNIGCMLECDFCQNWQTSQVKHLNPTVVKNYSPEDIINMALSSGIKILSWTYNDPVIWHEFIMDTASLAQKAGLINLYKSAFYIEEKPVEELIEVIDIFSLSLKSMDPQFYRKHTKGELGPMLKATKQVYQSGRHLEISQLLVTNRNEGQNDIQKTVQWILDNLDENVPLHFVGFHPAYKYLNVLRTPKESLLRARDIATSMGIKYCYIGNVYENHMADTLCSQCSTPLVKRFGLTTKVENIDESGHCKTCKTMGPIKYPHEGLMDRFPLESWDKTNSKLYYWDQEVKGLHLELPMATDKEVKIQVRHLGTEIQRQYAIGANRPNRIIISKSTEDETGVEVSWNHEISLNFLPVLDRAHFPTSEFVDEVR